MRDSVKCVSRLVCVPLGTGSAIRPSLYGIRLEWAPDLVLMETEKKVGHLNGQGGPAWGGGSKLSHQTWGIQQEPMVGWNWHAGVEEVGSCQPYG